MTYDDLIGLDGLRRHMMWAEGLRGRNDMKVERDNPETTKPTLESELAPGTVCHFPKEDTTTLFMRTDGSGEAACAVLADESGYFEPGELYQVDDVPVVVVDAALRVRG